MDFQGFPKIPRLNRDIIITEKIDGTNAAVVVDLEMNVLAQSRNRFVTPDQDNAGFGRWVYENAADLAALLGEGIHFGEWWGAGVQRRYAQTTKRFSLFNVSRWGFLNDPEYVAAEGRKVIGGVPVDAVPKLYEGPWFPGGFAPDAMLQRLRYQGSLAAPGFMDPEGIVVFHTASSHLFKATIVGDDKPKGER